MSKISTAIELELRTRVAFIRNNLAQIIVVALSILATHKLLEAFHKKLSLDLTVCLGILLGFGILGLIGVVMWIREMWKRELDRLNGGSCLSGADTRMTRIARVAHEPIREPLETIKVPNNVYTEVVKMSEKAAHFERMAQQLQNERTAALNELTVTRDALEKVNQEVKHLTNKVSELEERISRMTTNAIGDLE